MLPHYDAFGAKLISRCDTARLLADYAFYFKSNHIDITSTKAALASGLMSHCSARLQERAAMELGWFLRHSGSGIDENWDDAMFWAWMYLGTLAVQGDTRGLAELDVPLSLVVISFVACSSADDAAAIRESLPELRAYANMIEVLKNPDALAKMHSLELICSHTFVRRPSLVELFAKWREIASGFDPLRGLTTDDAEAAGWICLEWARTEPPHRK